MINLSRQPLASGTFEAELLNFLKTTVPKILFTDNSWSVGSFKHPDVVDQIIDQIAWWLFESDQGEALSELAKLNNPSDICGHVFKPGEATYTCRECATDPTCVFCQSCFRQSPHIKHKYKLHSSAGGGCCDCGDAEAWERYPSCKIHMVDPSSSQVDARGKLPFGVRERAEKFFRILLEYTVDLLTVDRKECSELPGSLTLHDSENTYVTVVFNDESHTFDYVIDILQRAVPCTSAKAADFATVIDREGRTAILMGTIQDCRQVAKEVVDSPNLPFSIPRPYRRNNSLITKVLHSSVFAHQEFALSLLVWMTKVAKHSEGLRHLISHTLIHSFNDDDETIATRFMTRDTRMWKVARSCYGQLIMSTVLLQANSKMAFAVQYTRTYPRIIKDFLEDDHDHTDSITSISVQLFTVPTLVRYLVAEENLLCTILETVLSTTCVALNTEQDELEYKFDEKKQRKNVRRLQYCFFDLKYILTNVPTQWDEKSIAQFKKFFHMLVAYLACLEGLDVVVRKTFQHLEHEPDWEVVVTLHIRLVSVLRRILRWCGSQEEMAVFCFGVALQRLKILHQRENAPKATVSLNNTTHGYIDYDISTKPVTVHYPLTRLVAGLLQQCGRLGISFDRLNLREDIVDIAERSFRTLSLCAQVVAGAWRRNGMSLVNQVYYSRQSQCRAESFNRDIQMLQACAALIDPNLFCFILHRKMNLNETEKFGEYMTSLHEEYLSIIIYVCMERYGEGIGHATFKEKVKRDLIHILASGPKPHSKILKELSSETSRKPDWEGILKEVANHKSSISIQSSAKYELKAEYLQDVSPFFYHYTTASEQTNAQNETIRRKKASNESCVFIPRPSPPFTDQFAKAINVLQCSFLLEFLKHLLQSVLPNATDPIAWSDKLIEKALYLIGCGVVEERERVKQDPSNSFKFCENAEEGGVLEVLQQLAESDAASIHKENIYWIQNAVNDVRKRRLGINDDFELQPSPTTSDLDDVIKKKELAQERRKNLIAQMKKMQKKFLENNSMFVEEEENTQIETSPTTDASQSKHEDPVCTSLQWQLNSMVTSREPAMCILCQDDSRTHDCTVMSAFVQLSSVTSKRRQPPEEAIKLFGDISTPAGIHISTCSHVMHFDCWSQYFENQLERDERRLNRLRRPNLFSYSALKKEFLCPLCSRLSNCVLPLIPHNTVAKQRGVSPSASEGTSLQEWLRILNDFVDPPKQTRQEVIVRLHLDAPGHQEDEEEEEFVDAHEVMSEADLTPVDMQVSQEYMDTQEDSYGDAFKKITECIRATCVGEDFTDEALLWQCAVTTFQVAEWVARYDGKPLMANASIRDKQTLSNTVRSCFLRSAYKPNPAGVYEQQLKMLLGKNNTSLLNRNIFNVFIHSIFASECLRENLQVSSVENDRSLLYLCSLAQLVQIMIFMDLNEVQSETPTFDSAPIVQLFNQVRLHANLPHCENIDKQKLENCLLFSFMPFIRSCVLFMHHVTNVSPPVSLQEKDIDEEMFKYLGLPTDILAYFDAGGTMSLDPLVQKWCSHPQLQQTVSVSEGFLTFPNLAKVNTLIELDEDYSDVISKASQHVCPRFGGDDDSISPTTCLVCGVTLCSQSYCCQQVLNGANVGACSYHSHQCSFGYGIFLKGQECTVVMLNEHRGIFRPGPYLDEHGETDQGLRRGNPLTLNSHHLKELNLLWLKHAIPETIVRDMESSRTIIHLDWAHV